MKRILWILGISAVILGLGSCDRDPIIIPVSGSFVVTPSLSQLALLGANPRMAPVSSVGTGPLFVCYSGWGAGHFYMMYDEPELPPAQPGEPSMSEAEWQELVRLNQPLGVDGKPRQ